MLIQRLTVQTSLLPSIASDNHKAGVDCANDMLSKTDKGSKIYVMDQPSVSACVQRENSLIPLVNSYTVIGTSDTSGDTAKEPFR